VPAPLQWCMEAVGVSFLTCFLHDRRSRQMRRVERGEKLVPQHIADLFDARSLSRNLRAIIGLVSPDCIDGCPSSAAGPRKAPLKLLVSCLRLQAAPARVLVVPDALTVWAQLEGT